MPCLISFDLGLMLRGVLDDFPGYTQHFCWAPCKQVHVVLEEVDELAFLFGVQDDLDLHSFGQVFGIDGHGLGILVCLENARCR
jgi:hypothetical protein